MTTAMNTTTPLLSMSGLVVGLQAQRRQNPHLLLRGIDIELGCGEVHSLVGESGAGKSMVCKSLLGILPPTIRTYAGSVKFDGVDLLHIDAGARRCMLGKDIALIPQDPMTALNPVHTIGSQMCALLRLHLGHDASAAQQTALEWLGHVSIRDPQRVMGQYPYELSGGMRQRVLIAMAFCCRPRLVVADEPTTALDVTVQRDILRLIRALQNEHGTAILFITHNLGIVAKISDRVSVIHSGRIVEHGEVGPIFAAPASPYTRALFGATPRYDRPADSLMPITDTVTSALWAEARASDAAWFNTQRKIAC